MKLKNFMSTSKRLYVNIHKPCKYLKKFLISKDKQRCIQRQKKKRKVLIEFKSTEFNSMRIKKIFTKRKLKKYINNEN